MAYSYDLPVVLTAAGAQPTPPATLQSQELAYATSVDPGLTTNLPALLLEDISSTNVGGLVVADAARVDTLNGLTPDAANVALLNQLGQIYGVTQGTPTNTSVNVVFSGTVGYVINAGFLVSDGTNTYAVQGGTVIASGGSSGPVTAVAVNQGSWAVGVGTVTQLQTSIPGTITLTVTNPNAGTPGSLTGETYSSYRTRILQAGLAASVGTPRYIKTLLMQQAGLDSWQVSVQQASPGIRIIVVGGDVYQVAYAIFQSVADVSQLVGSAIDSGRNVTTGLNDYPDTYSVLSVASPQQTVTMAIVWNTVLSGFTGGGAFQSLVQQPLADYINTLAPGEVINILEMNDIFSAAVAASLDPSLLTRLVFTVSINGTPTDPGTGTYAITGDAESYFYTTPSAITVTQG